MTPADFIAAFPVFKDVDQPVIAAAIADAAPFFEDPDRYGDFLAPAQNNLVAHFVFTRTPQGNAPKPGTNSAVAEDRPTLKVTRSGKLLERTWVEPFEETSYGRMFLYYQRMAGIGGAAAAGADCAWPPGFSSDSTWSG